MTALDDASGYLAAIQRMVTANQDLVNTELARQAEEFAAWQAVRRAAGNLGRAKRYKWDDARRAPFEAALAEARSRLAAAKKREGC